MEGLHMSHLWMSMSLLRHEDARRWGCWTINSKRAHVHAYMRAHALVRDRQDRFAVPADARTIGSAETIEKWVNRSNVLLSAALRLDRRAAFSSLAHYESSVGILTFRAWFLSLSLLYFEALLAFVSWWLFIFNHCVILMVDQILIRFKWNTHINAMLRSIQVEHRLLFKGVPKSRLIRLIVTPQQRLFMLKCGSMLHAQLEIWKAAVEESPRNTLAASWSPAGVVQSPSSAVASPTIGNTTTTGNLKESPCTVDFSDGTFFFLLARFLLFNEIKTIRLIFFIFARIKCALVALKYI